MTMIPLGEVVHFDVITSDPATGAATDADSAPTFAVYEEATDTAVASGTCTKRDGKTGNYRGTFTTATGFTVGKFYNVVVTGIVGGVTGKAVAMQFRIVAAEVTAGLPRVDLSTIISLGVGAYGVTLTVNDGAAAIEGASVRMTSGATTLTGTTNASGQVVFACDVGTWTVRITKAGYTFTTTTLAVSGTTAQTYSMSAVSLPAITDPVQVVGQLVTRDMHGAAQAAVSVTFKINAGDGTAGQSYDRDEHTHISDANGLITILLPKGATYYVKRGSKNFAGPYTVPQTTPFDIPEV